jgi:acyl phosphate:glycerol-3-phosphate acyltransferase
MDRTQVLHAAIPLIAYLLGSIPFGLIVGTIFGGKDVRTVGSGNIGATNVSRVAGPFAGILTLLLDAAKGSAAVVLAARVTGDSSTWMMVAGLCALVGHCYPVWLKFKGGKGVATAAGIFLVLSPWALCLALAVFILVVVFWRFVSLGSIAAAAAIPLLMYFLWAPGHAPPLAISFGSLAISLLVLYKHDANMQRLVEGTEAKFSFSRKSTGSEDIDVE